jgi:hypothetical protein
MKSGSKKISKKGLLDQLQETHNSVYTELILDAFEKALSDFLNGSRKSLVRRTRRKMKNKKSYPGINGKKFTILYGGHYPMITTQTTIK